MDLFEKLENLLLFIEKHADKQAFCVEKLKKIFKKDNTKLMRCLYEELTGLPALYTEFEDIVNALPIYWQHLAEMQQDDLYDDFLHEVIKYGEPTSEELVEYYEGFL